MYYESLMVVPTKTYDKYTNEKEKRFKNITTKNHQFLKKGSERGTKELQNNQKIFKKMAI